MLIPYFYTREWWEQYVDAPEAYTNPGSAIDFIVRGEGEVTFRELVRAMEVGQECSNIDPLATSINPDPLGTIDAI